MARADGRAGPSLDRQCASENQLLIVTVHYITYALSNTFTTISGLIVGRKMNGEEDGAHRQQRLYYQELVRLRVLIEYGQRYNDYVSLWKLRFDLLRAIASSGAIATWAIVQSYPYVWAAIIAASQVVDVLMDVLPIAKRRESSVGMKIELEKRFNEALSEWEDVFAGQFNNRDITELRRKMMQDEIDIRVKYFPHDGDQLPIRKALWSLAETDAIEHLRQIGLIED